MFELTLIQRSTAPLSLEETKSYLNRMVSSPHNGIFDFSVCLLPSDSRHSNAPIIIGKAGMWDGREIGFIFNKNYWGKGYAYEALQAVVDQYWLVNNQEGAEPIKADVDPRNEASLRLLKKLGFEVTGTAERTFETHIGWCDSIYLEAKRPTK